MIPAGPCGGKDFFCCAANVIFLRSTVIGAGGKKIAGRQDQRGTGVTVVFVDRCFVGWAAGLTDCKQRRVGRHCPLPGKKIYDFRHGASKYQPVCDAGKTGLCTAA